ncbi:MAG: tyrosine-type recombinase/integrase [Treponema sp.]|jgi:site-specific recombinase XerD|nr:tyrosine-type recombinase/integrase [Treponema sp.]
MMTLNDAISMMKDEQQQINISFLRAYVTKEYPLAVQALRIIDGAYTTYKRPKGYNLVKRDSKKSGFIYYVRYWHNGEMLSTKWCTHTNEFRKACEFAEKNRNTLIANYLQRHENKAVRFFKRFYDPVSKIFQVECKRNGDLAEERRKRYQSVMDKKFIPFLKERRIGSFEQITVHVLDDFQDILLADGLKAQSVNDNMGAIHKAFKYLQRKGLVKENPCSTLIPVPVRQEDRKVRGCYEISKLKGVFEKRWEDKISQLLNMIIYTTDMRNSEIRRFSKEDIIRLGGCCFIDLKASKTGNGIRLVPLHEKVYAKIIAFAKGMDTTTSIFGHLSAYWFTKAYRTLGKALKVSEEFLQTHNITYYSGRHFWKTLMNAGGLGEDIEEIFMGHKVSADVGKLYNHRDMQGQKRLVKKAREVFKILDKQVFADA